MSLLIKGSPLSFKKRRRGEKKWKKKKQCRKAGTLYKGHGLRPCQKRLISFSSVAIHQRPSQLGCHTLTEWHVSFIKEARAWENSYDKAWESSFPLIHHTHTQRDTHIIHLSPSFTLSHTIPSHLFSARLLPKNGPVIFLSTTHQLAVLFRPTSLSLVQKRHTFSLVTFYYAI